MLVAIWLKIEVARRSKPGGVGSVKWACELLARQSAAFVTAGEGRWDDSKARVDPESGQTIDPGPWLPTAPHRYHRLGWEGWRETHKRAEALLKAARPDVRAHWEAMADRLADRARARKLG
jgi:hypothetical protein